MGREPQHLHRRFWEEPDLALRMWLAHNNALVTFARTYPEAAGLTDYRWSLYELLSFTAPLTPPKRRGRRPRWLLEAAHAA